MIRLTKFCALACALTLPTGLAGQDTEWNRYTLEELGGVYVSTVIGDACGAAGVTDTAVRTEADAILTAAEVELLTEMGMLANPALPELTIAIDCAGDGGSIAYAVAVRMHQAVQMVRDPQITLSEAVTWFATSVGSSDSAGLAAAVTEAVKEDMGAFAVAYAEANAG